MRDGQIVPKIYVPLRLMKAFWMIPLSARSISIDSGLNMDPDPHSVRLDMK